MHGSCTVRAPAFFIAAHLGTRRYCKLPVSAFARICCGEWATLVDRSPDVFSVRAECPEQERAMLVLEKGFAIEQRLTVLVATHNVLSPKQAAPFQPDTVDQPGRNLCTAVRKQEVDLAAVFDRHGL